MNGPKIILAGIVLAMLGGMGFLYSGAYSMAADEPHWTLTEKLIDTLRERSISTRSGGIEVPDLEQSTRIAEGAEHYAAMCASCHLAPGMDDTEIRKGLYPKPPNLSEHRHGSSVAGAARQFWVVKHGIKMTAMPAWGTTHDDNAIWGLVAFLQKLPAMTPDEYRALASNSGTHEHSEEHSHGATEEDSDAHEEMETAAAPVESGHHHEAPVAASTPPVGHHDAPGAAPHSHAPATPSGDPREVASLLNGALASGDTASVQSLLLPDVLIFESGAAETSAAQYAGHHMPADMAFLAKLSRQQVSQLSGGDGESAWIATRSRLSGRFEDKQVDLDSTETLVLRKTADGWRVAHIHWSSAPHSDAHP